MRSKLDSVSNVRTLYHVARSNEAEKGEPQPQKKRGNEPFLLRCRESLIPARYTGAKYHPPEFFWGEITMMLRKRILSLALVAALLLSLPTLGLTAAAAAGPDMPANVSYSPITDSSVTISWDAVAGATSYNIYRRDSKTAKAEVIGTVSSIGYVDNTVVPGTDYWYSVSASNADGEGKASKEAFIILANNDAIELIKFNVFTTGSRLRLGDLDGDGRTDILVVNTSRQSNYTVNGSVLYAVVAYDLEGNVMWSFSLDEGFDMTGSGVTNSSADEPVNIADLNGDGYNEVALIAHPLKNRGADYTGGVFIILDGRTGKIMKDSEGNDCRINMSDLNVPGATQSVINTLGDCIIFANFDGRKINDKSVRQHVIFKARYANETAFEMFDADGKFVMNFFWRHTARNEGQENTQTMAGHTGLAVDLDGDGIDEFVSNYSVWKVTEDGTTLFAWWWIKSNLEMRSGAAGDPLNDPTPAYKPGTTTQYKCEDHVDTIQVGYLKGDGVLHVIFGGGGKDGAGQDSSTFAYTWDGKFVWCNDAALEPQSLNLAQFRTDEEGLMLYGLDRRQRSNWPNGKDGMFVINSNGETVAKEDDNSNNSWSSIVIRVDNWTGTWAALCASFARNAQAIDAGQYANTIQPSIYDGYFNQLFELENPSNTAEYRFMAMDLCGDARTELLGYTDAGDIAIFYNGSNGDVEVDENGDITEESALAILRSGITGVPKQQSTFMSNYSRYPTDVYYDDIAGRTPAQPQVRALTATSAYIDWTPIVNATSYDLYRNGVKIATSADIGFLDTGLESETEYSYYVIASNATGVSPNSLALNVTTTASVPTISLSGDASVIIGETGDFVVTVANMEKLATATLWFEVDGTYFENPESTGLNEFFSVAGPIDWTQNGDSTWIGRVTLYNLDGVDVTGALDIFKMVLRSKGVLGDSSVKLIDYKLSGYDEDGKAVWIDAVTGLVSIESSVTNAPTVYSKYDINRDGKVDQLDLTTAQKYFAADDTDADWDISKIADVNEDGCVDIADFILILNNIEW